MSRDGREARTGRGPRSGRETRPPRTATPGRNSSRRERQERPLGSRAPQFVQASRTLHLAWQVGVFTVGLAIVGAGVLLLPLPGPGWLVIFGGMAVWATEFVWAQLVLRWTKRKVTEAAHRAMDPRVRRRNTILMTIVLLAVVIGVGLWIANFGVRMPWEIA